jgi:nicotinamide-nucleotide amidase
MQVSQTVETLVQQVAETLGQREWQLITAESCTGGLIGAMCTDLPGSSAWFYGGVTCYANEVKQRVLNVTGSTLMEFGAVSEETVMQMCAGALTIGGDIAVAVSGVAGPDGGTPDKPVGCVYIGWQIRGKAAEVVRYQFDGDRDAVRLATVAEALTGIVSRSE